MGFRLFGERNGAYPKIGRQWTLPQPPAASAVSNSWQSDSLSFTTTILTSHKCLPEQVATIMSQTQVVQTDPMEDDDPHSASEKKQKTRRPASAQDLSTMHCSNRKNI
jgi:hypothetical protein